MKFEIINLDDEQEVESFIEKHKTLLGKRLANSLGLRGKGSIDKANSLSNYAWNKKTAMSLRKKGQISEAITYENICDSIYSQMDKLIQW